MKGAAAGHIREGIPLPSIRALVDTSALFVAGVYFSGPAGPDCDGPLGNVASATRGTDFVIEWRVPDVTIVAGWVRDEAEWLLACPVGLPF